MTDKDKQTQFLELLRTQHSFPGSFTMKFIGTADDDFAARVVHAVRAAMGANENPPHTTRPSGKGGLVSVTLMPICESPEQVLAIYEQVRQVAGIKVSL